MIKKRILAVLLFLLIIGLNAVSAENDTLNLNNADTGTFSELSNEISYEDTQVDLYKNYKYDPTIDTDDKFDLVPCVFLGGANNLTIDGHGHTIDGSNQVGFLYLGYTGDNIVNPCNIVLKNINFINGNNTATYMEDGQIWCESYGAITIINGVKAQFINCTFENNNAYDNGGIIYINNYSDMLNTQSTDATPEVSFEYCNFINNYALNNGGAIYNNNGKITITNSNFTNNQANMGSTLYNNKGLVRINNSTITNNKGETAIENNGQITINNSIISNNQYALTNGRIEPGSTINITHSILENNTIAAYNYGLNNLGQNTINLEYNSIVNNNINLINAGNNLYGKINAKYNWWGTNQGDTKSTGSNINNTNYAILTVAPLTSRMEETRVIVDLTYSLNNGEYVKIPELMPTRTINYTSSNKNGQFTMINNQLIGTVSSIYKANQEPATLTIKVDNQESNIQINITNNNTTPINDTNTTPINPPINNTNTTPINPPTNNTNDTTNTTEDNNTNNTQDNTINTKIEAENLTKNYKTDTPFKGKLLDSNNNPIIGHHIDLKLIRTTNNQNKIYDVVTDYNGEFILPINLAPGTYSAEITYHGLTINDKTYTLANHTSAIIVQQESDNRTDTIITTTQFIEPYGAGKSFSGYLQDTNNNPILGHHIKVKLTRLTSGASKTYDAVTDYTGQFLLTINLARGEYTAQCTYDGTDQYKPSTATNTLTIY